MNSESPRTSLRSSTPFPAASVGVARQRTHPEGLLDNGNMCDKPSLGASLPDSKDNEQFHISTCKPAPCNGGTEVQDADKQGRMFHV